MYYDANTQLLRLDINPDMDADEPVSPYKSIHDYNTGEVLWLTENYICFLVVCMCMYVFGK